MQQFPPLINSFEKHWWINDCGSARCRLIVNHLYNSLKFLTRWSVHPLEGPTIIWISPHIPISFLYIFFNDGEITAYFYSKKELASKIYRILLMSCQIVFKVFIYINLSFFLFVLQRITFDFNRVHLLQLL